ncbi:site-specific DNA-methyltransferase [Anaeromyxobacter dehalogenans]|nr:site-specific DNA-methyltransferase [Anaeromyxobacter dehalogenans]
MSSRKKRRPAEQLAMNTVLQSTPDDSPNGSGLHLEWEGRRAYRSKIPIPRVLEPDARLSKGDGDSLVVEGDNLQVMVSLRSQFNSSVDVAYIDPPYNRGGNDFRYSDARYHDPNAEGKDAEYVSNEDGGRHTKWLNYMAPRLAMIRELMKDTGVIFVSINDIELFRLGMLMDEIFDEKNRIGIVCWKGSADNNPSRIAIEHEYVLCYAKRASELPKVWRPVNQELSQSLMEEFRRLKDAAKTQDDLAKSWKAFLKDNKASFERLGRYTAVDERGPYQVGYRVHNTHPAGYRYDIIHPVTKKPCRIPSNGYRYTESTMKRLIDEGRIIFGKTHEQIVQMKDYLDEYRDTLRSVVSLDARKGAYTLKALFGDKFDGFDYPKPVELIELLVGAAGGKDALVLDAFAGSGTTAHAVMRLNKIDGGRRRFILIEEGNGKDRYARTLIVPRLRKAAKRDDLKCDFRFLKTGRELDRDAILGLERDRIINVICQTDRTGVGGGGIKRVDRGRYVIGHNKRDEAIALVWNGRANSAVTVKIVDEALAEVAKFGLKTPLRIYGTVCRISETRSFTFCQIPDEILASLHYGPLEIETENDERTSA